MDQVGPQHRSPIGTRESQVFGLVTVLVAAIAADAIARFTNRPPFLWQGFYLGSLFAFIVVPLAVARFGLRFSRSDLGFAMPRLSRQEIWAGLLLVVLGTAVAVFLLEDPSYLRAYAEDRIAAPEIAGRLIRFSAYTISATLPFELMHRGFLLFGIHRVLTSDAKSRSLAAPIAILVTMTFEVALHLGKPPLEPIALLFGSPILSWIALRTRSVAIPFALHFYIESLFFWVVLA